MDGRTAQEISPGAEIQHRILQAGGARFSLKLELAYWTVLEALAKQRGLALRELVRELAASVPRHMSLAAGLRLRCFEAIRAAQLEAERRAQTLGFARGSVNLELIVRICPAPALVVAGEGEILLANAAFATWYGSAADGLEGQKIEHIFQIKAALPIADVVRRFRDRLPESFPAKIAFVRPGRVVVARAVLCPGSYAEGERFTFLVMVEPTR